MMKKLSNNSACVFTGKGLSFGGSLIGPEATGYGLVYFTEAMLKRHGLSFEGMRVAVSGSGDVGAVRYRESDGVWRARGDRLRLQRHRSG